MNSGVSVSHADSWLKAQEVIQRRIFLRALAFSFALHLGVAFLVLFAPKPEPVRALAVISVHMVALPSAATAPKALPAKTPSPAPLPAKPKPVPLAKKVILPKRAGPAAKKPKAKPKPEPLEYDDALAALREELGEEAPTETPPVAQEVVQAEVAEGGAAETSGVEVDPDILAWKIATLRHFRKNWRVPDEFMNRSLATEVMVRISLSGEILSWEITRPSSDPYWDDVVRGRLVGAKRLPPPLTEREWIFRFVPEEGS